MSAHSSATPDPRNDSHRPLKRLRHALRSVRWLPTALTLGLMMAVALWGWRRWTASALQPRWADLREGEGTVLALAAGVRLDGPEVIVAGGYHRSDNSGRDLRIVCYYAPTGGRLWEVSERPSLPNMSKVPNLAFDPAGDVLVGWDYWSVGEGTHPVIAKLAGMDGQKLWEWKAAASGHQSGHLAVPTPDTQGRVWVAGIQQVGGDEYRRFLALLDTRDGSTRWQRDLNPARDANDRRATVHPMTNGDAIVVAPPRGGERPSPWLLQRVSGESGEPVWMQRFTREDDRSLPALNWLVDVPHAQVVVFQFTVTQGRASMERVSFDLHTGKEKWRWQETSGDDWAGGLTALTSDEEDNLIAWSRRTWEWHRVKWWSWHKEHGMWWPDSEGGQYEQPLRTTFSARDGSLRDRLLVGRRDERINEVLVPDGRAAAEALILRDMTGRQQVGPWRVLRIGGGGGRSWREALDQQPSGPSAWLHFPYRALVTPHGRIVIAGDPEAEDRRAWQLRVW